MLVAPFVWRARRPPLPRTEAGVSDYTLERRLRAADALSAAIGPRRPDEELVGALRKVASLHDGECTTTAYLGCYMAEIVHVSPRTFFMRYGSWTAALDAAGLTPASRPGPYSNRTTDEALLAAVRECADALGHLPTLAEYKAWRTPEHPCDSIVRTRLGGWRGVLRLLASDAA